MIIMFGTMPANTIVDVSGHCCLVYKLYLMQHIRVLMWDTFDKSNYNLRHYLRITSMPFKRIQHSIAFNGWYKPFYINQMVKRCYFATIRKAN